MARSRQQARKKKQKKGAAADGKSGNVWKEHTEESYKLAVQSSERFEEFYKMQKIVPEGEWDQFLATLKEKLPSTFRITGFKSAAKEMLQIIKSDYFSTLLSTTKADDDAEIVLQPPKCLSWYPDELAWQINMDKKFIRHSAMLKKLHQFLVQETESGNISRQEAVSMIPPLVLDVKPHHKVLDMCAAPGSKTAQLLEMLHADETQPIPEGFVMGNDSDNKRCYLMIHQVKRLESPNFLIVNHDATQMPNLYLTPWGGPPRESKILRFDRILADVPCTGDGTTRKNPDVWQKWKPTNGYNMHTIQLRILERGLALLEPGGRLVYSTCSFNPVENEAVLATALTKAEGAVHLLDVAEDLKGLKSTPGLSTWKLMSQKSSDLYNTWEDVPQEARSFMKATMFPPAPAQAEDLHLERCVRVLPHHQDTGGFFIAALQKTREVPWGSNSEAKASKAQHQVKSPPSAPAPSEDKGVGSAPAPTEDKGLASSPASTEDKGLASLPSPTEDKGLASPPAPTEDKGLPSPTEDKGLASPPAPTEDKGLPSPTEDKGLASPPAPTEDKGLASLPSPTEDEGLASLPSPTEDKGVATVPAPSEKTTAQGTTEDKGVESDPASDVNTNTDANSSNWYLCRSAAGIPTPPSNSMEETATGAQPSTCTQKRKDAEPAEYLPSGKKQKIRGYKEDPFIFLDGNDPIWTPTRDFFGFTDEFPLDQTLVRCDTGKKRNIYFTSSIVKKIVQYNSHKLKVVNLGLKVLSRSTSQYVECDYRLVQEGVNTLFPFLTKRIVHITKDDIITLLTQENPFVDRLTSASRYQLNELDQGGCVFLYEPREGQEGPQCRFIICGWKGKMSCRSFMPKYERAHYLRLCGAELQTKEEIFAAKAAAKAQKAAESGETMECLADDADQVAEPDEVEQATE